MITDGLQHALLDNGLQVLTKEVHSAPVTSFWIWYRVGSRNEKPGLTGLSHWVEHMLFKGTPTFPQGDYDRLVQREGGTYNGMTWIDWTTYYETLPSDRIELALRIESDRMINSIFDPKETESERTVIISEREGSENSPRYLLYEQVQALSFLSHPYHHMVIGWKEDLRNITRDDLYQHYKTYYAPNNAIVIAVGDFNTANMLSCIEDYFGNIPPSEGIPEMLVKEPPARGERRILLDGPEKTTYLAVTHRAPAADHPDFFPMVILDAVLGGAKGMPPFGSASLGRSARLYRALVNTGLAVSAHSSMSATVDPYLFGISATVHPERTPDDVEKAILVEIQRLQEEKITDEELGKAIKGARVQFAYGSERVTGQAMWIGLSQIASSSEWLAGFIDALSTVTAEDVQRVAQSYLTPKNRVVGLYVPTSEVT